MEEEDRQVKDNLRIYRGVISDSERWHRFKFRSDDIIITTPSKCGTTWMQSIVGTLVFGDPHHFNDSPVASISLWLDAKLRSEAEAFAILEAQTHRRFLKTHCPLDGIPRSVPGVTYIAVIRHPLDVALSDYDHSTNQCRNRTNELLERSGHGMATEPSSSSSQIPPQDRAEYLKWWVDNDDVEPDGAGPHSLSDYCQQVKTYWDARNDKSVHLFHYTDLWNDLNGEMRRVADILGVTVDESCWHDYLDSVTLESMKNRADITAPEAHLGLWKCSKQFFAKGGQRDWSSLLTKDEIAHFEVRLECLAGDATNWILKEET